MALVLSLGVHALLLVALVPALRPGPDTTHLLTLECPHWCQERQAERMAYQLTVVREPVAQQGPAPTPPPRPQPPQPQPQPQPQEQPQQQPQPQPPEPLPAIHYMVHLDDPTHQAPDQDTPYLAQDDSRTDHEVQAEVTTLVETDPGHERSAASHAQHPVPERDREQPEAADDTQADPHTEQPADEQRVAMAERPADEAGDDAVDMAALARASSTHLPLVGPNPNSPSLPDSGRRLDLSAFNPSMASYRESHLAADDRHQRQRIARQLDYDGYRGGDDQADWERTRAALENMVPEVRTGTETRLNARRSEYADYISYIHRRIHPMWAEDYLVRLDLQLDPGSPLSDPNLETVLELVIASNGEIQRVNVVRTSGITEFDGEAISVAYHIGPLRPPPAAILSANGNAYIHWTFWRDQRECGTFGASVHQVRGP